MTEKKKESGWEALSSLAFAIGIALIFRSFAYEPFHIPSGSMLSTLYEGDYIFVSKFSYGYSRYSFPFNVPPFSGRILEAHKPARGDVVVFRLPPNPHVDYIKRIVGLPGDRIQVKQGRLYINDVPVEVTRRGDVSLPGRFGEEHLVARYDETLPGGKTHVILNEREGNLDPRTGLDSDNTGVYTVPEGDYFMMGDNRDNSQDSRYSAALGYDDAPGYVPEQNIVGRAVFVLGSFQGGVPALALWRWPEAFRNDRWFTKVR
ncbi:MAG: signal peptidase I [Alphaproteobacteria bacterium]